MEEKRLFEKNLNKQKTFPPILLKDACSPNPCQNSGTCSMTTNGVKNGFACQCKNGYTGTSCQTCIYDLI